MTWAPTGGQHKHDQSDQSQLRGFFEGCNWCSFVLAVEEKHTSKWSKGHCSTFAKQWCPEGTNFVVFLLSHLCWWIFGLARPPVYMIIGGYEVHCLHLRDAFGSSAAKVNHRNLIQLLNVLSVLRHPWFTFPLLLLTLNFFAFVFLLVILIFISGCFFCLCCGECYCSSQWRQTSKREHNVVKWLPDLRWKMASPIPYTCTQNGQTCIPA